MNYLAIDTETHLISVGNLAPELVCVSYAGDDMGGLWAVVDSDGEDMASLIRMALLSKEYALVFHNAPFDLAVLCRQWPDLLPLVFAALEEGRIYDTMIREKLINLTDTGNLEFREAGDAVKPISYSLAALAFDYLGLDLDTAKNAQDAWRLNYEHLASQPSAKWPRDACEYAISDAVNTLRIFLLQSERAKSLRLPADPFLTESFQNSVNFALHTMAMRGFKVDRNEVAKVEALILKERAPENQRLLVEHGILIPGKPPESYLRDPTKFKVAIPEKISKTTLMSYVVALAGRNPEVVLKYTDPSDKFPQGQVSVASEFIEENWHLDPVLEEYRHRTELDKLVSTYVPALKFKEGPREGEVSELVHGCYDALKRTGRTSSFSSKLYPSFNVQNQDPRIRGAITPRDGMLLCSVDYGSLELCTLAQKQINIFGRSSLADIINADICPHEFLGAQIAYSSDASFRGECLAATKGDSSTIPIYRFFHTFKKDKDLAGYWKDYRTLAKPTGLGYPGGLGVKTFIQFAKGYGQKIDSVRAQQLKDIWMHAFPEMPLYFDWIKKECIDLRLGKKIVETEYGKEKRDQYAYTSPFGLYRAGCDFCAAANGAGMQSFAADGAKLAVWEVVKASTLGALKGRAFPLAFIHDEILLEIPYDDRESPFLVASIMREAMESACPDVKIKAQPCLMDRWDKNAETVLDAGGTLQIWKPQSK